MWRSVPQIPAALTSMRTSPAPILGTGTSRSSTKPSPLAVLTSAVIVGSFDMVETAPPVDESDERRGRLADVVDRDTLFAAVGRPQGPGAKDDGRDAQAFR